jgi:hypothetical protein
MPVCVKKIKDKYRIVECSNNIITKNEAGTAVDGGGHETREAALRQMRAINRSQNA